ncbi:MAG: hypothetical protein KKF30_16670 [Proteobacteria bacterium]|nr:hypothetical protein [Pseudomonadota bacterium]MBU4469571.1 hypothetical protein [Pseudomonadota bacterium]
MNFSFIPHRRYQVVEFGHGTFTFFLVQVTIPGKYLVGFVTGKLHEYFEMSARIQDDRGHKVVVKGPYRFLRHPGYVALILACLPS